MQININDITSAKNFISEVLLHLNISLSSYKEFPNNMKRALKTIGEFSHHDRIHIVEIHHNMTYTIRHEWCNKQVPPSHEKWKHAKLFYDSPLEKQLCTQNHILIHDINELTNTDFQVFLQEHHCQQMLILPLFESSSQFAFIIFMQCHEIHEWTPEEIHILTDLSSVIATQLNNYYLIKQLLRHIKRFKNQQEPQEILYKRLKQLHKELLPTWNQIKDSSSEFHQKIPGLLNLDQQITTLDHICHALSEK